MRYRGRAWVVDSPANPASAELEVETQDTEGLKPMAFYQVLSWQGIPSQVKAWDDFDEVKLELSSRFVARIDQAAQSQGLTGTDDYLSQWNWSDEQEREGTAHEVAEAVKKELESRFP